MIVADLLNKLNFLIKNDPSVLKLKVCGMNTEFKSLFVHNEIVITEHDWNDNIWCRDQPPEIEKVLLMQ